MKMPTVEQAKELLEIDKDVGLANKAIGKPDSGEFLQNEVDKIKVVQQEIKKQEMNIEKQKIEGEKLSRFKDPVTGKRWLKNEQEKIVVETKYQKIDEFHEWYAKFKEDNKWWLMTQDGNIIINAKYDYLSYPTRWYIMARIGDRTWIFDDKWKVVIPIELTV